MATQKRRVVYFTDPEWAAILAQAKVLGVTASAYIRERTTILDRPYPHERPVTRLVIDEDVVDMGIGTRAQQRAAAQRIDAGQADITRIPERPPEFRPVPKPSQRK